MTKSTPNDRPESNPADESRDDGIEGGGPIEASGGADQDQADIDKDPSVLKQLGERIGSKPTVRLRDIEEAGDAATILPPSADPLEGANAEPADTGRYKLLGILGSGGVGAVHRGHDCDLGRDVAMKFLHERYAKEPSVLHRFVEEAQIGGQLQHPGIVPVYELGMADGKPFFTMKMVKGETLAKKLSERSDVTVDRRKFLVIFEDICQTMAYAHARGVVHRDLKPANIMIGAFGEVQVVDWGMGKVLQAGGVADELRSMERQSELSVIETARSTGRGTQSIMGSVMGTPAYMPPEQARGDVDCMDERSDVFALGAILCEILTGMPPYVGAQSELIGMAALGKLEGARARLVACGAEEDLVELAMLCLMPSPAARPRSAGDLAKAVLGHLAAAEERVHEAMVRAISLKRTQKMGTTLAVMIAAGLMASLWFWLDSVSASAAAREQRLLANTQRESALNSSNAATRAGQEAEQERVAAERAEELSRAALRDYERLSYLVRLQTVKAAAQSFYPAWPDKVEAMKQWLAGDAAALPKEVPVLNDTLAGLRVKAVPQSEAEVADNAKRHPRAKELASNRLRLQVLEAAQAVRFGGRTPVSVAVPSGVRDVVAALRQEAERLSGPSRRVFGREAEGLACARRAMELAPATGPIRTDIRVTLAWSLFANGLDDDARKERELALREAGDGVLSMQKSSLIGLAKAIAKAQGALGAEELETLRAKVKGMQGVVGKPWFCTFEKDPDQFLYDTLRDLVVDIEALDAMVALVKRDLRWAERVEELTITKHSQTWADAKRAILDPDGGRASELYAASRLTLEPQMGLVPIGMNPVTKLWEFYHLRSAWDGVSKPEAIAIPVHQEDGSIQVTGQMGVVFVLLPGGAFTMGAQQEDEHGANFDLEARPQELLRAPRVKPFFLARHEVTNGQWLRLHHGDPSERMPSAMPVGASVGGLVVDLTNPVENISWNMSDALVVRQGLMMPTEVQWEYGCRAGTATPWSCSVADIRDHANLLDKSWLRTPRKNLTLVPWDDGHMVHAPVGSFAANAFGLYDVHGNLWEMTRTAGDAAHRGAGAAVKHIGKGGSWKTLTAGGSSSGRRTDKPTFQDNAIGLRLARSLAPQN